MLAVSLLGWLAVGGLGFVMASKSIRRWTGPGGEVEEIHGSLLPEIVGGGAMVALSCYFLGVGLGLGGGPTKPVGAPSSTFVYGAPNAPSTSVFVSDTSTWIVSGGSFVGSGDDTHDSTNIQVLRVAGDTLTEVTIGAQTTDTLSDNTDWKADSTYVVRMRYKGAAAKSATWSTYDSATVVNATISVLQHTDWSTGTGTAAGVLRDTAKAVPWTDTKDNDGGTVVVTAASTGLTWPASMTNVLQIWALAAGTPIQGVRNVDRYDVPAIGESRFHRWFFANTTPDSYTGDYSIHPLQDGTAGGIQRNWLFREERSAGQPGKWTPEFAIDEGAPTPTYQLKSGGNTVWLDKDVVYRFEVEIQRVSSTAFIPQVWIYSVADALLYGPSNWVLQGGSTTLADEPEHPFNALADASSMQLGSNGWSGDPAADFVAYYYGGWAVCLTLCGQYPIDGVEN